MSVDDGRSTVKQTCKVVELILISCPDSEFKIEALLMKYSVYHCQNCCDSFLSNLDFEASHGARYKIGCNIRNRSKESLFPYLIRLKRSQYCLHKLGHFGCENIN